MRLLVAILDLLFPPRDHEALVRAASAASLGAHLRTRAHEDGSISLLPYRAPLVRACIIEAKFRDNGRAQELLASALASYLFERQAEDAVFEAQSLVLVPIPLSAARERERGYNQAERIARRALRDLPAISLKQDLLRRTRDTLPQTSLGGRKRRENVAGAFSAARDLDPAHTYIVFDDVRTTGATLAAATDALRAAGAARIYALSLAH